MNAQTSLSRPSTRAVIATACIVLWAVAPLAAFADPPIAPATRTLESKVSLADLDLSTAKGVRGAHKRLTTTGEHLCRQLRDSARPTLDVRRLCSRDARECHRRAKAAAKSRLIIGRSEVGAWARVEALRRDFIYLCPPTQSS